MRRALASLMPAACAMVRAGRAEGLLLSQTPSLLREDAPSPSLPQMTTEERLTAYYAGPEPTVGKRPMAYRREELRGRNILSANELQKCRHGELVRTAGCIIARQRPGTAHGFIFLSMEDETGLANVIVTPDLSERERIVVTRSKFLLAEGPLQNQDGVIHVKATHLRRLSDFSSEARSHDFH